MARVPVVDRTRGATEQAADDRAPFSPSTMAPMPAPATVEPPTMSALLIADGPGGASGGGRVGQRYRPILPVELMHLRVK